jgi:hypothetical protein
MLRAICPMQEPWKEEKYDQKICNSLHPTTNNEVKYRNLLLEEEGAGAAAELVGGGASVMKNKPDI